MRRSRERRLTVGWGKMIGGGGTAIRMPVRVVLRRVEVDTQLQGGSGGKAATWFGAREKHDRAKGRRGCLSGCYEWGGERTGAGTSTVTTWRRREEGSGRRSTLMSRGPRLAAVRVRGGGSGRVGPI
jgi:hypothetical protein